jgi:hypothetical protein
MDSRFTSLTLQCINDLKKIVLGAGLEPASLSAYAPQTYVSASSTTRAL